MDAVGFLFALAFLTAVYAAFCVAIDAACGAAGAAWTAVPSLLGGLQAWGDGAPVTHEAPSVDDASGGTLGTDRADAHPGGDGGAERGGDGGERQGGGERLGFACPAPSNGGGTIRQFDGHATELERVRRRGQLAALPA
jgi:hypothetical protein